MLPNPRRWLHGTWGAVLWGLSGIFVCEPAGLLADPTGSLLKDTRLRVGAEWPAGSVGAQLDAESTLIPYGKGAIFVPAMRSGLDEPPVEVLRGEERVGAGTAGQRILLPEGTYTVRLGSGVGEQRLQVQATVRELSTTVIPSSWSVSQFMSLTKTTEVFGRATN